MTICPVRRTGPEGPHSITYSTLAEFATNWQIDGRDHAEDIWFQ
jgi:hypothetical protein